MVAYEKLESRFKDALLDWMKTKNPFWSLLGMEIIEIKKGWAKIRLPFSEKLANGIGVVHGGAIFSPADSAVGMALIGLVGKNENISTLEMKINYLRPLTAGDIIAAINGLAIGGGFTIPLACADLIYVSEHAWVMLPFINLGLIPELASSYLLPRLVGFQRAKEIIYFGEKLPALQLYDMGLVNKVLPHDDLVSYAKQMALKLIPPRGAGLAARLAKQALHRPLIEAVTRALDIENEGLNKAIASADFWEALAARKENREPVFKGE